MKCYWEKCEDKAVAYFIEDDVVACENHAVWNYFRYFQDDECGDECPSTMGGSCACEKEKVNG
jgi:hypothetical protein